MFDSLTGALSKAYSALAGHKTLTDKNVDDGIRAVRQALLEADVNFKVAKDFIKQVKDRAIGEEVIKAVNPGDQFVKIFHDELTELLGGEAVLLPVADTAPLVLMMAGLQGAGKTTTCAKLALWLRRRKKKKVMLVAADLQRPAAVDQLVTLGRQLDIPVHAEGTTGRPAEVCQRGIEAAKRLFCDVVILDTAGRLHIDEPLMRELEEIHGKCKPHGVLLVCDSMLGQDAVNSAREFHSRLPLHGVVLTKVDGDSRAGAALSVKAVTGRPILFAGTGEKVDELEEWDPARMAGRLLGMGDVVGLVEKAQEVIDEKEAQKAARKLQKGQFDFDDFLKQLNMLRKMGPLKKVLGMLPGVGSMLKDVDLDNKEFARMEAVMLSMTPHERRNPGVIDVQRRRRIAQGSGNDLDRVNALLKQFKAMQKMMKSMKGGMPDMSALDDLGGLGGGGLGGGGLGGGLPKGFPKLPPGGGFMPGGRRRR
ncbi:MAG: signal recognition particle protein [Planctomycetes bacterium]|nr:signal recognition particle protein [Planctomycetota bacterium]